jgi:hypothetical protein
MDPETATQPPAQTGTQPALPPATPNTKTLKLYGTTADSTPGEMLAIPPATTNLQIIEGWGPEKVATYRRSFADIEQLQSTVNASSHFLTQAEFKSYSDAVANCNKALQKALTERDEQTFRQEVEYLRKVLGQLHDFVEYEKKQGLVGTCADTGVRIYLTGDKVWLCTPDKMAFRDLRADQKEKLKSFVKGITGVSVNFDSAYYQEQGNAGRVALLGCRLDALQLRPLGGNQRYTLTTTVRRPEDFVETTVSFTLAELKAGKVPGVFGQSGALPLVDDPTKRPPNPVAAAQLRGQVAEDSKRLVTQPARLVPLIAATAKPPARSASTSIAAVVLDEASKAALEQRTQLRQAIAREGLDTPEKLAQHGEKLSKGQQAYDAAVKKQRELLEAQKKAASAGSVEYNNAVRALKELDAACAEDVLLRKSLFEKQLTSTDPAVKAAAQKSILQIRKEVDALYERMIAEDGIDPARKATLQLERENFTKLAGECRTATIGRLGRALDSAAEKLKGLGARLEARHPSFAKVRAWLAERYESLTTKRASTPTVVLPADQASALRILQDRFNARTRMAAEIPTADAGRVSASLAELDASQASYEKAVALRREFLETQKKNNHWSTKEHQQAEKFLRDLERMEAKDAIFRKDLLQKQIELADPAARPALQRTLERIAPKIDKAYENLLADSTVPDAEKAALRAQREALATQVRDIQQGRTPLRAWVDRAVSRIKSVAEIEIRMPGSRQVRTFLTQAAERSAMADVATVTKALSETTVDGMNARQRTAQLELLKKASERFKAQIERLGGSNDPNVVAQVKQLKDADAQSLVRRSEILERQLAETSDAKQITALKQQLHSQASDIEGAYRHLGKTDEANAFATRARDMAGEVDRATRINAVSGDPKVREATKMRQEVETKLAKATAGSADHAELTAMRDVAVAKENLAVVEAEFTALREKYATDSPGGAAETELSTKRAEVVKLREAHALERVKLSEVRIKNVDTRLTAIDAELKASGIEPADVTRLESERRTLLERKAELVTKHESLKAEGFSGPLKQELARLQADLDAAEAKLKAERQPDKKQALEQVVGKLRLELLEGERQLHDIEIRNCQSQRGMIDNVVGEIDAKIAEARTAGKLDEVRRLESTKTKLQSKAAVLKQIEDYHTGMRKVVDAKIRVERLDALRSRIQARLDELQRLGTLDEAQRTQLESRLRNINDTHAKAQADVLAFQKEVKLSTGRMLKQAVQRFEGRLNAAGDWAKRNPLKAATIVAAVGEGFRNATTANYSPDAKHTAIPTLLLLLDSDLEDGYFGANVQFQTKDAGVVLSALAEFGSGAGNATIVMGGFTVAQKSLALTAGRTAVGRWVGTKLATATAGRAFVGVGAAADGFLTFYDYNSWKDDNALQLTGKTASPIVMGAGFGAFFGPPGAVIGAGAGAIGEFGGLVWGANALDAEIDKDWRKRGVRDSIRQAEEGYVYTADHPVLRSRSRELADHEKETIDELSKQRVLGRIFASQGGWSHDDLRKLGFRLENTPEAGQHNWARLEQLLEQPRFRWVYNLVGDRVRIWENESQTAFDAHGGLMSQLHGLRAEAENYYRDRYFEAPRISYDNRRESSTLGVAFLGGSSNGGVTIHNERPQVFKEAADLFKARMKELEDEIKANHADRAGFAKELCEAQWRVLVEKFPQLGRILATENGRSAFFAQFQAASGIDLRTSEFWTHKPWRRLVSPSSLRSCPTN